MPDISMCQNTLCPSRGGCKRFISTPNERRQSYAWYEPDTRGYCDSYWPVKITTSGDTAGGGDE